MKPLALVLPLVTLPLEALAHPASESHAHHNPEILLLAALVAVLAVLRSR